jgi:hypothetical protein
MAITATATKLVGEWLSYHDEPGLVISIDADDVHQKDRFDVSDSMCALLDDLRVIAEDGSSSLGGDAARTGDEYCLILPADRESELAEIIDAMDARAAEAGVTLSIGIARGTDASDTLIRAERALIRAKVAGKNQLVDADA